MDYLLAHAGSIGKHTSTKLSDEHFRPCGSIHDVILQKKRPAFDQDVCAASAASLGSNLFPREREELHEIKKHIRGSSLDLCPTLSLATSSSTARFIDGVLYHEHVCTTAAVHQPTPERAVTHVTTESVYICGVT